MNVIGYQQVRVDAQPESGRAFLRPIALRREADSDAICLLPRAGLRDAVGEPMR
ncbi:MAG: hypothetical protein ACFCVA_16745 [Gammaproteobacteria bacterium]